MTRTVDARGLACPLPALKARLAARDLVGAGDTLVVLATDPEAPIDVGAVAADANCAFTATREDGGGSWRLTLVKR